MTKKALRDRIAVLESDLCQSERSNASLRQTIGMYDEQIAVLDDGHNATARRAEVAELQLDVTREASRRALYSNRWVPLSMTAEEMRFSIEAIGLVVVARNTGRKDHRLVWDLIERTLVNDAECKEWSEDYLFRDARRDVVDAVIEDRLRRALFEVPCPARVAMTVEAKPCDGGEADDDVGVLGTFEPIDCPGSDTCAR